VSTTATTRDAELLGFLASDVLAPDVDDEQCVGWAVPVLDAAERSVELFFFADQAQHFVLDQLVETAVGRHLFDFFQARDRRLDGAEIGQHAAEPARRDVRHAATDCFFLDRVARRALGADEQHRASLLDESGDEVHRVAEQRQRLFEIDDMDLAARTEDVRRHARIPVTGLVAEMHASFEHLAHRDLRHGELNKGMPALRRWPGFDLHVPSVGDLRTDGGAANSTRYRDVADCPAGRHLAVSMSYVQTQASGIATATGTNVSASALSPQN
jgi:hypothetical protein